MTIPGVVLTALVVGTIGYVIGAIRVANRHDRDVEWLVGRSSRIATNVRLLYALLEQPCPDMDVERQPEPSSWARLRQAAKDRHPAGSRLVQPEPEELHELDEVAREFGVDLDEPEPDPDPATDPVGMPPIRRPQPGPATVPAAAVIDAEWEQKRDAMVATMLAEIRGTA